jgi:hypothetical protein
MTPLWGLTYLDHIHLQYAGQIGFLSAGVGKKLGHRYSIGFMYGYVPHAMAGGPGIETFTFRQNFGLLDFGRHQLYLGLNIFHVAGIRYATSQYGEAPRNYYAIGSWRGLLYLGIDTTIIKASGISFYVESGLNDIWIENSLANFPEVNPLEHLTLALGFKKTF